MSDVPPFPLFTADDIAEARGKALGCLFGPPTRFDVDALTEFINDLIDDAAGDRKTLRRRDVVQIGYRVAHTVEQADWAREAKVIEHLRNHPEDFPDATPKNGTPND